MDQHRAQALQRLLGELDTFDATATPYRSRQELTDHVMSVLLPFLENPARHGKHVAAVIKYVQLLGVTTALQPLLRVYRLPFLSTLFKKELSKSVLTPLMTEIQVGRDDLVATVDPCRLDVDLLPVTSATTKADWKRQALRLVLIELRSVATPASGMQLLGLSQQLDIVSPDGCQVVDAIPSSVMEVLGDREVSISERGKFTFSAASSTKLGGEIGAGPVKLSGGAETSASAMREAEASTSETVSEAPQVARVISSVVRNVAVWRLLRTPSQLLLGTNKFSVTALVPADAKKLGLSLTFGGDVEGWGPTSIKRAVEVVIPPLK